MALVEKKVRHSRRLRRLPSLVPEGIATKTMIDVDVVDEEGWGKHPNFKRII